MGKSFKKRTCRHKRVKQEDLTQKRHRERDLREKILPHLKRNIIKKSRSIFYVNCIRECNKKKANRSGTKCVYVFCDKY
jgi:predicted metal-binding protein